MKQISRASVIWQLVAFFATLGPHLTWMPIWLIAICILTPGIRLMIYTGRWPLPHWSLKLALILAVAAGLMVTFTRETGMRATVALLIAGLALKLIEIYHRRDALVLLYVALFLTGAGFLFHQSILMALYALMTVVFIIAALNSSYQDPLRTDLLRPLRRSLRLVGFALPVMLVLFIVFPRIGPLWSMPLNQQAVRSGLSDSMSPGDISRLTRSAELAFRVSFDGQVPSPEQRYWRSMVYSYFDGRTWSRIPFREQYRLSQATLLDQRRELSYEVIFEASNNPWLVALDQPVSAPSGARLTKGNAPIRSRPVDRRISYRATSVLDYRLQPELNAYDRELYLQLPAQVPNPRSRELAEGWWQETGQQPQQFVQRALGLFNREFSYTLTPPVLSGEMIDAFLFDSKQGFCGHYAGALTYLLRSVGVPARVVAGYQGGEWNAQEAYLTVRQYDAHAWVEYWMETEGWIRVDPTAAVAPERVNQQADQLFANDPAFLSDTPLARLRFGQDSWLVDIRRQIDALNFNWQRWVLNYQGRQMDLLQSLLGKVSMTKMALLVIIPVALVLLIVAWGQLGGNLLRRQDPLERSLTRLLSRFERLGYRREPRETLQAFSQRMSIAFPSMAGELRALARCDEAMRYAGNTGSRKALLAAIRACYRALKQIRTPAERE
ncbi:transglutaminase TgpA family protein [Marinobacterium sp. YM272]|uniref:transglutaminase TgpA family protein n=1 Tax=Marinobacterium sp. YM272 TaxID=3421654 RepID=UPI003D7F4288